MKRITTVGKYETGGIKHEDVFVAVALAFGQDAPMSDAIPFMVEYFACKKRDLVGNRPRLQLYQKYRDWLCVTGGPLT